MQVAIETRGLTKLYGKVVGVQEVNLEVQEGETFGFLGPNGAGKSTCIRLLCGFLRPTQGHSSVFGWDTWREGTRLRRELGFLPDFPALYENLTGRELLEYLGRLQAKPPLLQGQLLERLELGQEALHRPVKGYSRGMRQKLALVQALQHDPALLILDEPTEGLDPLMQQALFRILRDFQARGKTIFMSSHILSEVERLCHRAAMIRSGRIVGVERVDALRQHRVRVMEVTLMRDDLPLALDLPCVLSAERDGHTLRLRVRGDIQPLLQALATMPVKDLVYEQAHLEDIFLELYREPPQGNERIQS
ncbi:MAG: ABC transporter ATP-binding protein [Chloroflexi bacterium]|nr:ABC transporter ATP-binding protein [Chloroflexota bacterium]